MELIFITPETNLKVAVEWIEVTTLTGNTVIQPGHAPMITILDAKKTVLYQPTGQQQPISKTVTENTILHVTRTSVTLISS